MNAAKSLLKVLTVLVATLGVSLMSCHFLENPRSSFATYEDAHSAGMFAKGWLPAYLPQSAYDIRERHNLDSNRVQASFKFTPSDTKSVRDVCRLVAESSATGAEFICPWHEMTNLMIRLSADGAGQLETHAGD